MADHLHFETVSKTWLQTGKVSDMTKPKNQSCEHAGWTVCIVNLFQIQFPHRTFAADLFQFIIVYGGYRGVGGERGVVFIDLHILKEETV